MWMLCSIQCWLLHKEWAGTWCGTCITGQTCPWSVGPLSNFAALNWLHCNFHCINYYICCYWGDKVMKSIFKWKSQLWGWMKGGQKGRWKHSCVVILYHHPTLIHISTIDQTPLKVFGNTGWITQGWEIHLCMITILKILEPIKQEAKQIEFSGIPQKHYCQEAIP